MLRRVLALLASGVLAVLTLEVVPASAAKPAPQPSAEITGMTYSSMSTTEGCDITTTAYLSLPRSGSYGVRIELAGPGISGKLPLVRVSNAATSYSDTLGVCPGDAVVTSITATLVKGRVVVVDTETLTGLSIACPTA